MFEVTVLCDINKKKGNTNIQVECLVLLLRIREALGSNLGPKTEPFNSVP
jgi:hypothetical protein